MSAGASVQTGVPAAPASARAGEWAMDLANVSKTYMGKVHALRGISMRVRRGEVFGLLGPNGAGKSTLVKILMTVIKPTKCQGTLLGEPVGRKATLARVGYLPEHHKFPEYLTGAQVLDFYGALAKVPRHERRVRRGELLDLVGMTAWADKRVKTYSKGMRQRVGVAQALMNDPDLVLLDEPTDGVDPVGRRDIRLILTRLKEAGKSVFVNSHILSELESLCDRVAILVQGVVASQGTLDELTKDKQRYEIEVEVSTEQTPMHLVTALPRELFGSALREDAPLLGPPPTAPPEHRPGGPPPLAKRTAARGELATGEAVEVEHGVVRVGTTDPVKVQPLIDALRSRGVVIRAVRPVRPSLEDLFMQAVTDPVTGEVLAPGAERPPPKGPRPAGRNAR